MSFDINELREMLSYVSDLPHSQVPDPLKICKQEQIGPYRVVKAELPSSTTRGIIVYKGDKILVAHQVPCGFSNAAYNHQRASIRGRQKPTR